jgi:exosome complex exonuclease RRP6
VCNLFDTGIATRILNYSANGLGYLLGKLCGFDADKRFQLADWRIRPLSEEAIHYARADTHYLLYCYDVLRCELANLSEDQIPDQFSLGEYRPESGIFAVLEASKKLCYSMFEKDLLHEFSFMDFYSRSENKFGVLNDQQLAVFAALYEWRDEIARERDESPGFVMSRANMVEVAKAVPQSHKTLKSILKKKSSIGIAESRALLERIMKFLEDDSIVSKARAKVKQADDDGQNELPEKRKLPLDLHRNEEEQGNKSHKSQFVPKQLEKSVTIISSKNAHGMMMRKASENVSKRKAVAKAIRGNSSIPIEIISVPSGQYQSNEEAQPDSNDLHEKDSPKQEILPTHDTAKTTETKPTNVDDNGVDDKMMSEDMIPLLPLPLSEQKSVAGKSRRRRSHNRLKQKPTRNGSSLETTTSGKYLQDSDNMFDPSEAVTKYNSTKKRPNTSHHKRRNPKQEMQQSIPSGMFNPYGDLQSIGSKSKRSTTQIRSGNRTSNFK